MQTDKLNDAEFVMPPLPVRLVRLMLLSLAGNFFWAWSAIDSFIQIGKLSENGAIHVQRTRGDNLVTWIFVGAPDVFEQLVQLFYTYKYHIFTVNVISIFLSIYALATLHRRMVSGLWLQIVAILLPCISAIAIFGFSYLSIPFNTIVFLIEIIFIFLYFSCRKTIYKTFK